MSAEQNKQIFRMVVEEGFNKRNFAVLDDLFAPDYQEHQFGLRPTLEGMKQDILFLHKAFPDFHLTIEEMIADENSAWARMTGSGTNLGPFMGPPTGKAMRITVFDQLHFKDGKISDHWGSPDRFAALAQLGLLPQPQTS